jgi:CBS domain-containing protein
MTATQETKAGPTLKLTAATARDLMARNPVSIRADANVHEALALLTDKGFSAAPVIDDAGRPVGVLSRSDLLVHDREKGNYLAPSPAYFYEQELHTKRGKPIPGFQVENVDTTTVRDLMTPAVFAVAPTTPAAKVVSDMIGLHVHRLFVVDEDGILVGVISTMDILKHLKP